MSDTKSQPLLAPAERLHEERFTLWSKNNMIVIGIGMALAVDYSLVMVALPNYWATVAPDDLGKMGLIVGLYDLSQFIFAPAFGWLADRKGLKFSFLLALWINIGGNVLYSLGIVIGGYRETNENGISVFGTHQLLAAGRFIAGIGSGALALSAVYFTVTTSLQDRLKASVAQQAPLVFARSVGPAVGCTLIAVTPQYLSHTDRFQQTFNFLTEAGWLCVFFSSLTLLLAQCAFDEPKRLTRSQAVNGSPDSPTSPRSPTSPGSSTSLGSPISPPESPISADMVCTSPDCDVIDTSSGTDGGAGGTGGSASAVLRAALPALQRLTPLLAHYWLNVTARMGVLSCYVYLSVAQFRLVQQSAWLWAPWMGVVAGSIVGVRVLERLSKRGVRDHVVMLWSALPYVVGMLMMLDYRSHAHNQSGTLYDWLIFYVGSALVTMSGMLYMPNNESFYTKQVTRLAAKGMGAGAEGLLTSTYTAMGALGRFAGPLIAVYILTVKLSSQPNKFLSACPGNFLQFNATWTPLSRDNSPSEAYINSCSIDLKSAMGKDGGDYITHVLLNNTGGCGPDHKSKCCPLDPKKNPTLTQTQCLLHACEPLDDFCFPFVFPQHFFNAGCSVMNVNWFLPLSAGLVILSALMVARDIRMRPEKYA